jgi:MoaA/NifB/PqqE/SkfB family radical SAM enzyme
MVPFIYGIAVGNAMALFTLGQMAYYAGWFLRSKVGVRRPLVLTMVVTYHCNLDCDHCLIHDNLENIPRPHSISYEDALEEMRSFYEQGSRILFFEGGEPTIWKDGDKRLSDLIKAGKQMGYFVTGYTTNGTNVIFDDSDVISVSLDGPREIHDKIRAPGVFDRLMMNLEGIEHPNIFANMVVNRTNIDYVEETVRLVANSGKIQGIMLNFLTPPPKEIALSLDEKKKVVGLALVLKKKGLPILNTTKALEEMLIEDYETLCPHWMSAFVTPDGTKFYGCPFVGSESCKECGFDAVREYRLITKGSYSAITQMSKRFALSKQ